MRAFENSAHERKIIMTIAEKREIVNTIINLLLQLTAEEEVQEQPATSSKPVKAPAQSVRMLTIKECTALIGRYLRAFYPYADSTRQDQSVPNR